MNSEKHGHVLQSTQIHGNDAAISQWHTGMQARVQNNGEFSEPFEVTNWVKQGCVMAPTLFSIMFSTMLMYDFQDSDTACSIRYRFVGNVFNLRRLQAKPKEQIDKIDELLYSYDMDKNYTGSEAKMQRAMDQGSQSCDNYDLTISTKRQRLYTNHYMENSTLSHTITANGELRKPVLHMEDFVQMSGEMESSLTPSWVCKVGSCKVVVLPTLLYACGTGTVYQRHVRDLNILQQSCMLSFWPNYGTLVGQTSDSLMAPT